MGTRKLIGSRWKIVMNLINSFTHRSSTPTKRAHQNLKGYSYILDVVQNNLECSKEIDLHRHETIHQKFPKQGWTFLVHHLA
jgi:hypothetical protein